MRPGTSRLRSIATLLVLAISCQRTVPPTVNRVAVATLTAPATVARAATAAPTATLPTATRVAPPAPSSSPANTRAAVVSLPDEAPIAWLLARPMPASDEARLAREFLGLDAPPDPDLCRARDAALGDSEGFWVDASPDGLTAQLRPITATLVLATEGLHVWLEKGAQGPGVMEGLRRSAEVFENEILPANRRLFGMERDPALPACPLTILNAHLPGVGGYFASSHLRSRDINPYSSERPMLIVSLASRRPGAADYEAALAHELQHMIHHHLDPNEEAWVNEGLSNLAEELNGYPNDYAPGVFVSHPNIALASWGHDPARMSAHYGGPQLLVRYLAQRYGVGALGKLVREPLNGIVGWDAVLRRLDPGMTFDAFYADWVVSLALGVPYPPETASPTTIETPPLNCQPIVDYPALLEGALAAYGTTCWSLGPGGRDTLPLSFEGQPDVALTAAEPASGHWVWWSNRGDRGHSGLELTLDLRHVPTATLAYDIWYDIEAGWDYAYLRASVDGGQTWELLQAPAMVADDPVGHALGLGYTGASGDWVYEVVSLGRYVGHTVRLRFDYVTDDALNKPGLLLDNIEVEALGWRDDVEQGEGKWRAEGFLRLENRLPQRYLLQIVTRLPDGSPTVQRIAVDDLGQASALLSPAAGAPPVLVLLSAVTPVTTEPAAYRLAIGE
jgi:hypothetical protein